jgi:hypothetical protein
MLGLLVTGLDQGFGTCWIILRDVILVFTGHSKSDSYTFITLMVALGTSEVLRCPCHVAVGTTGGFVLALKGIGLTILKPDTLGMSKPE